MFKGTLDSARKKKKSDSIQFENAEKRPYFWPAFTDLAWPCLGHETLLNKIISETI